jgi:hypothetical protein
MTATSWPSDPGQTISLDLAAWTLLDVDTEIRRVGRETVAAIAAVDPDVPIERRIVTLAELARETREPEPDRRGVVVAVISWLSRSGSLPVVGITLGWDGTESIQSHKPRRLHRHPRVVVVREPRCRRRVRAAGRIDIPRTWIVWPMPERALSGHGGGGTLATVVPPHHGRGRSRVSIRPTPPGCHPTRRAGVVIVRRHHAGALWPRVGAVAKRMRPRRRRWRRGLIVGTDRD